MKNTYFSHIFAVTVLLLSFLHLVFGECPFPKSSLPHGRFIYQNKLDRNLTMAPDNYLLRFKCRPGHVLKGSHSIYCYMSQWTDKVPKCLKISCNDPPSIENGTYDIHSGISFLATIGSFAVYSCSVGYELVNSSVSTLNCSLNEEKSSAEWLGEIPSCQEKDSCPDPGTSADGYRKGESLFVGDFLKFGCNDSFELVGKDRIECLPGGIWSSPRPLCRPLDNYCEMPPTIQHGVAKGDKKGDYYRVDDEVDVTCDPGYSYKGVSEVILCEEDGQWEEDFGECTEIFCDLPDPLKNGTILEIKETNSTRFPYHFQLTYVCDEGFRLYGDSWRFCEGKGWSGESPYCEVVQCPVPGDPEHGTRSGSSMNVGDKVVFRCFTGYELIGSFERYCMPNGQWGGELARCDHESNYCPDPGIPINGMKGGSVYDMGSIVTFQCQNGYTLLGSEARECLPNRTWSGSEVKCVGPYDFDNNAKVGELMMAAIAEKEAEQKEKTEKYREALYSTWKNGTISGRVLDLNFPGRLILYFAFDVSGSVGEHNFKRSIEFAKAIVKRMNVSEIGARVGALTFSSKAEEKFLPLDYKTTEEVLDALDKIEFTGGGTSASSALALIREELIPLTQAVLHKRGQKSIIFILTDGKANMGGDPQQEAQLLKDAGVEIYCIGITSKVRVDSLSKIASSNEFGSKDEHVFILQNYDVMSWLVQTITNGTIDYSQCGLGLEKLGRKTGRGKIVGGRQAPKAWPWMAALYYSPDLDIQYFCGGSIISKTFILTAAHCLYTVKSELRKAKEIIVKLGLTNVQNETNMQEYEVKNYYIHPNFRNGEIFDYDIALLRLKRPIEFNAFIRPICLPPAALNEKTTLYKPGHYAVATGYGYTGVLQKKEKLDTISVENLKEIILPIQSKDRCLQSVIENMNMDDIPGERIFTDRMLCVGDGNGGNDTCRGDSGGPLMQSQQNSEGNVYWIQVGIVSWGIGCGLPNTYGYYTHVQRLQSWIANTTRLV